MRYYAMQVGPQTIDVRRLKTLDPLRMLSLPVGAALSGHRAVVALRKVRCFFRIFTYGFHRIVRVALLVWEFVSDSGWECERLVLLEICQ